MPVDVDALLMHSVEISSPDTTLYQLQGALAVPPGNIDLTVAQEMAASAPTWAARGKAIQAYAAVEQSLCSVMGSLLGISLEQAAIMFFKITSAGSRNSIIEKLLKFKFGPRYNLFWNAYLKEINAQMPTPNPDFDPSKPATTPRGRGGEGGGGGRRGNQDRRRPPNEQE